MKRIYLTLIIIFTITSSIYANDENKSVEQLKQQEKQLEENLKKEKENYNKTRKERLMKEFNSEYQESITLFLSPNFMQGYNGPNFREMPYILYYPRLNNWESPSRNSTLFLSYYNLPENIGFEFYSISIASKPNIIAFNPADNHITQIVDAKQKNELTLLIFKMFDVTKDFKIGFLAGFTNQNELYTRSDIGLSSFSYFRQTQKFSGWGPELGLRLQYTFFGTVKILNNLSYNITDNNYSYSTLFYKDNFQFYIEAYDTNSIPGVRVITNNKSLANGSIETSSIRNFFSIEFPIYENIGLNFGLMTVFRKIKFPNFNPDTIGFARDGIRFDTQNGSEQYLLTSIFYENAKNQNTYYSNLNIGITLYH
ncbi:hypothetical protein [Leptospira levettii]|uniref:hypothetical protein n=2 Tax=Leptospira levettii TaxID=2023178 RepID=UPI000C2A5D8C|nr:hypothetical protein [Leptospira levettii]PJZ86957.1 hypothetical protein CH368_19335 [Leptospira levettii]